MSTGPESTLVDAVDAQLKSVLDLRSREITAMHASLAVGVELLRGFLAGGKRLRPQFCWWGWQAGGGREQLTDCEPVVRVAAALELLQACALVHDDLIDRSDTRRGRPSVHRAEAKRHADEGWSGDAEHFGSAVALLLGDLALAWSDDEFTEAATQLGALPRTQPVWRSMRTQVLAGQWLDLLTSQPAAATVDPELAVATARTVIVLKTAGYTVTGPLLLGATLANAPIAVLDGLQRYGTAIGTAFQLRDDLLGVFGAPAQTGKPAGDDLREGKRTVLLGRARHHLLTAGDDRSLAVLDAGIGFATGAQEVDRLRTIITDTGAPQEVEELIGSLVTQARAHISALPVRERVHVGLREIADRAAHRSR